jgi:hypothetical protein
MKPALSDPRSLRRQRLAAHLYRCGPRPVFGALLAAKTRREFESILHDFSRLPPHLCHAVGAAELDAEPVLFAVAGGRR